MQDKQKIALPFSAAEYRTRLDKTLRAMALANIDVLFVEDPSNMSWLTGYDGWSFYVHQGVLVFQDRAPIWWGRNMDAVGAKKTVYLPDADVLGYHDDYIQSSSLHPMQDLAKILQKLGYDKARIGLEYENYYFSAKAYLTLKENLPEAHLCDATALVNWQRLIKSDAELAFMRQAAKITNQVVTRAIERIEPGLHKHALVAQIYADAIAGVGDAWGDYPAIVPLLPSGALAAAAHLTWDDTIFKRDEGTFLELSGCYRRYHAPTCRTVFLGQPPQDMLNAEQALIEGLEAGIEQARPGARASDVANALYRTLEKYGITKDGRCGYPIGLSYPPDWGERTVSFRPTDHTLLEPGMVFHFMPGLWMESWGLEITECIHIRETGPAECLTEIPRAMVVKP